MALDYRKCAEEIAANIGGGSECNQRGALRNTSEARYCGQRKGQ